MKIWQILLIVVVALLGLLYIYLKTLKKGALGEFVTKLVLKFLRKEFRTIHDLTFDDGEKTVQVDHLVVSPYGIFVIETKNYSGTIYGKENSEKFTQYLGKSRNDFYSPIKQNRGHIYSLKKILGDYKYVSIIAFSGNSKLKVETDTFVGYIGDVNKYIKSHKEKVIDPQQINEVMEKIKGISLKGFEVHKQHVKDIKERMQVYDEKVANMVCPKCGGKLLQRKGQYGDFLGCSNYPKCKFRGK